MFSPSFPLNGVYNESPMPWSPPPAAHSFASRAAGMRCSLSVGYSAERAEHEVDDGLDVRRLHWLLGDDAAVDEGRAHDVDEESDVEIGGQLAPFDATPDDLLEAGARFCHRFPVERRELGITGGRVDERGEDATDVGPVEELHDVPEQHGEVLA